MADKIVFNYTDMANAVTTINNIAQQYAAASASFQSAMANATANWEGHSKDKFMAFVTGPVKTHMETNIPDMVKGIATLLDNNAKAMQDADTQVGNNMPTSL